MASEDQFRHYFPLMRRVIILVAVLTAVPVILWTITVFVRGYFGPQAGRSPARPRPVHPPEPRFVGKHDAQAATASFGGALPVRVVGGEPSVRAVGIGEQVVRTAGAD